MLNDFLNSIDLDVFESYSVPIGFILFLLCLYVLIPSKNRYSAKKKKYIKVASKKLKRLNEIDSFSGKISFLRIAVNPYVFEEMILTALQRQGHKIIRGNRYTHDGGVDGKVMIKGTTYFIQAKKYSNYVNPKHVAAFIELCGRHGVKGLFVHSGKTGDMSKSILQNTQVKLVSGDKLIMLLSAG
ncbi:hypothetical protein PULV_a3942 [Pseudoalteromonas ulvae UL12]|uniref:restriction endonuclease n=1 Tax=Pseudoalteromonas ulvae TaxID=107327 RepID=UPI00186B6412|nr:restriction endonuclease [Pseudoalteromonas ulvae]MBE0362138.1 hypothetical protein [Pseudoalteromonas ulvae UL12]